MRKKIIKHRDPWSGQEITMTIDDRLNDLPKEVWFTPYQEEANRRMGEIKNFPAKQEAMSLNGQ